MGVDPLLTDETCWFLAVHFDKSASIEDVGAFVETCQPCRSREPFTLVMTDLGMPYLDARSVANAVKSMSPSTPVILLTGFRYLLTGP
jgi:CheY-like chemotaxis protein